MLPYIVLIVLMLFFIYLVSFTLINVAAFLINASLMLILAFIVSNDLKKKGMQEHYIIGVFLTAILLIFSNAFFISAIISFFKSIFINVLLFSMLAIVVFANAAKLAYKGKTVAVKHGWHGHH